jgi:hypothetical protein
MSLFTWKKVAPYLPIQIRSNEISRSIDPQLIKTMGPYACISLLRRRRPPLAAYIRHRDRIRSRCGMAAWVLAPPGLLRVAPMQIRAALQSIVPRLTKVYVVYIDYWLVNFLSDRIENYK